MTPAGRGREQMNLPMRFLPVLVVCGALFGCGKKDAPNMPPAAKEKSAVSIEDLARTASDKTEAVPAPAEAMPPAGEPAAPPHNAGRGRPGEPMNPKEVRAAIDQYFEKVGNFPNSWQDMIREKLIKTVPLGKNGRPLDYKLCVEWIAAGQ